LVVIALEQRDVEREGQERVRPELEQLGVVMSPERFAFGIIKGQPRAPLPLVAVQDEVGLLGLPPGHGAARVRAVPLDQLRVPVHGVEELVQQVLAHISSPPIPPRGYQVKYASMVWNRSSESV